jgi:hypothetical protein
LAALERRTDAHIGDQCRIEARRGRDARAAHGEWWPRATNEIDSAQMPPPDEGLVPYLGSHGVSGGSLRVWRSDQSSIVAT